MIFVLLALFITSPGSFDLFLWIPVTIWSHFIQFSFVPIHLYVGLTKTFYLYMLFAHHNITDVLLYTDALKNHKGDHMMVQLVKALGKQACQSGSDPKSP